MAAPPLPSPHPPSTGSGSEAWVWGVRGWTDTSACPVQAEAFGKLCSTRAGAGGRAEMCLLGTSSFKGSQWPRLGPEGADTAVLGSGAAQSLLSIAFPLPAAQGSEPAPRGPVPGQGQSSGLCPLPGGPSTNRMSLPAHVCRSAYGRFWGTLPWTPPW